MGKRKILVAAAALAVAAPFIPSAQADSLSDWDWAPHVHVSMDGQAYCDNSHTTIKLWGTFTFDTGLSANVTFTNSYQAVENGNTKHVVTKTLTESYAVQFSTDPETPTVYNKNGESGVGGNPYISIGFLEDAGLDGVVPIGDRIFVGRCVMGNSAGNQFKHIEQDLNLTQHVQSLIQALECDQKGTAVGLGVGAHTSGLDAEVYLDNNKNKIIHEATDPASGPAGIVTTPMADGTGYSKNGHVEGAGGNPLVDVNWVDGDGASIDGAPNIHGVRCNKL